MAFTGGSIMNELGWATFSRAQPDAVNPIDSLKPTKNSLYSFFDLR
jgi:hypothetical protein